MNVNQLITASLLATSLAGMSTAGAGENNPLHPSYFWNKTPVREVTQNTGGAIAAPITNPLHPGYFAVKVLAMPFIATGTRQPGWYVDDRNPLHPGFRRS
jgi:hypothetical protein